MATAASFSAECRKLREVLDEGIPISELDYRILRSNIVLLLADLERFGRADRPQDDAAIYGFLGQGLHNPSGPEGG